MKLTGYIFIIMLSWSCFSQQKINPVVTEPSKTLTTFNSLEFDSLVNNGKLNSISSLQYMVNFIQKEPEKYIKANIQFNDVNADKVYGYLTDYPYDSIIYLLVHNSDFTGGNSIYLITYNRNIEEVINEMNCFSITDVDGINSLVSTRKLCKNFLLTKLLKTNFGNQNKVEVSINYSITQVYEDGVLELFNEDVQPFVTTEVLKALPTFNSLTDSKLVSEFKKLDIETIESNVQESEFVVMEIGYPSLILGKLLEENKEVDYVLLVTYYSNLNAFALNCVSIDQSGYIIDYIPFMENWEYGPTKNNITTQKEEADYIITNVYSEGEEVATTKQIVAFGNDGFFILKK